LPSEAASAATWPGRTLDEDAVVEAAVKGCAADFHRTRALLLVYNGIDGRIVCSARVIAVSSTSSALTWRLAMSPARGDGVVLAIVNFTRRFTK